MNRTALVARQVCLAAAVWLGLTACTALPAHRAPLRIELHPVTVVQTCTDPGDTWCGGDTFSLLHYAPDGHYREDGTIPTSTTVTER